MRQLAQALALTGALVAGPPAWAWGEAAPAALDELLARARAVYLEDGPGAALPRFEQVLTLYREAGDRRGEAITLGYIGNCHKRFGDYPKALELLDEALRIKRAVGDRLEQGKTLSHLGLVYWNMGEYPAAIERFEESLAIGRELGDAQLEGSALNNLSLVHDELGDYRRSLAGYRRVLELYRGIDFPRGEGDTLGNIGGVHLLLGEYAEAMSYFRKALAISERLGHSAAMAADLTNIARCELAFGEAESALATLARALRLAREAHLAKEEAVSLEGRAAALAHLGRYDEARESYRQALDIYERSGLDRELIDALSQAGNLYALLGDVAAADRSFRRGLERARAIGHPLGVTFQLIALGDLERRRDRFEEAGALYREALARSRESGLRAHEVQSLVRLSLALRELGDIDGAHARAREGVERARAIGARTLEAAALHALAEAARERGSFDEALGHYAAAEAIVAAIGGAEPEWQLPFGRGTTLERMGRDEEAVAAYRQAAEVLERVRSQLREERYRSGYLGDKYQVYVALVRLLVKLERPAEAFHFSEKLRARSLARLVGAGRPVLRGADDRRREVELRERIRQLERAVEAERAQPGAEQRRAAVDLFSAELIAAEHAYQAFLDDLRASDPRASAARALAVPPLDGVQRGLPPRSALVEYVVDEGGVLALVVTATAVRATRVEISHADLEAAVELLRGLVLRRRGSAWTGPAARLRRVLLAPLESAGWLRGIERLFVVPHDVLHYLPFGVLLDEPRASGGAAKLLVEEYVLAGLPSAALLTREGPAARREPSLLAMAPSRSGLVHAEAEVRALEGLFPEPSAIVVGPQATESRFKSEAGKHSILHLATHGTFNKLSPLLSGLELEPDARDDGRLEVHEILDLELDARLVTLSACETALGSGYFTEVPVGDDFVGLTRAFLFAGSEAVMATLWKVDDRSTRELMRTFYDRLGPADAAAALAAAQRRMLRAGGPAAHPYFWAPFVVLGATP